MDARSRLRQLIDTQSAVLGVVGLGYVGFPLAVEMARSGFRVLGFDLDERVVDGVNRGESHIDDVSKDVLGPCVEEGMLSASTDLSRLSECDAISICVPTPLNKTKDPDLSYVVASAQSIRDALRPGQLIVLESTTYPGTTREVVLPVLEESGLAIGSDFFLCFSPERVDPGNSQWHTRNTPKVLGGITPACREMGLTLYEKIFDVVVPVADTETAELVKVFENTFRMINIALVNELAQVCDRLGIDVWEVIDAAATKPFGFMKFTPGPGLGGHCIPLDPHYLSWKMRALEFKTRMIEVASEINSEMPRYVVQKIGEALNDEVKAIRGSRVLVLGVAYKKNVADLRESPAIDIIRLLQEKGAVVSYYDPHCPIIRDDGHTPIEGLPLYSVQLDERTLSSSDVVVIVTDHDVVDYDWINRHGRLIVDTRGVMRSMSGGARIMQLASRKAQGYSSARVPALI